MPTLTRRLTKKFPHVLAEPRNGAVHLTGLSLLALVMTQDNSESLLSQARGKFKREIEELIARLFPKPDVPELVLPIAEQLASKRAAFRRRPGLAWCSDRRLGSAEDRFRS